ncbi:DUF1289 domain-containing protein [Sphingomonas panacisoli]|uniref:DUF1289 domain-containing protein n=1 Tax=Sphingomonas panacisoli TaxID=1813879 RepID=A0A5B8LEG7_9SPHN|nr:DUF1289 domain-containing protein [Sphingomonas panacisoli]QDZ06336.1 DUF1289 domain-containing protein [Sphingomonas panacisoli]
MSLPDFISIVPVQTIESPCVNICTIGEDRLCEGCRRSINEIAQWSRMTPAERRAVMAELPTR